MPSAARSTSSRGASPASRCWQCRAAASDWWPAGRRAISRAGTCRAVGRRCRSIAPTGSCTTATSRPRSCDREPRSAIAPACRCRTCWQEFGANNFYGGNAPSREWTNQTLIAADHRFGELRWLEHRRSGLVSHARRSVRLQPAAARAVGQPPSHARGARVGQRVEAAWPGAARSRLELEGGGDWIRSTNLGDHATSRISGFGEWRQEVGAACSSKACFRVDTYDEFGTSWNPSIGAGWWASIVCTTSRIRSPAPSVCRRSPSATTRIQRTWRARTWGRRRRGPGKPALMCSLASGWLLQSTLFGRQDRRRHRLAAPDDC